MRAVLGDLADVCPFEQPETDIGVAQAVGRPLAAFAVEFEAVLSENGVELLLVIGRENEIGCPGKSPAALL